MAIQFIKPEAAKCFSGIQGAFSEVSKADSTIAKVVALVKTIILLPFLFIRDSLDLITRPFRSQKLTYKGQLSYAVKYAKLKIRNGIQTVRNFDINNVSTTTKVAVSAGLLVGSIYIYKNGIPFSAKEETMKEKILNHIYPIAAAAGGTIMAIGGLYLHRKRSKATSATSEDSKLKTGTEMLNALKVSIKDFYDKTLGITFGKDSDFIVILFRNRYNNFTEVKTHKELADFIRNNSKNNYSNKSSDEEIVQFESTEIMNNIRSVEEAI